MRLAIEEAKRASDKGEVPVGCVIVHEPTHTILAQAHNLRESLADPTAHAEIVAIRHAAAAQKHWRLLDCTLVVTLEPCPMCAGAIVNARIPKIIYGCADPKAGAVRTLFNLCDDPRLNHRVEVVAGVLSEACGAMLTDFFRVRRGTTKNL